MKIELLGVGIRGKVVVARVVHVEIGVKLVIGVRKLVEMIISMPRVALVGGAGYILIDGQGRSIVVIIVIIASGFVRGCRCILIDGQGRDIIVIVVNVDSRLVD